MPTTSSRPPRRNWRTQAAAGAQIGQDDYQARGVLYLPREARFRPPAQAAGGRNIGRRINDAMRAIEAENPDLKGVLPKTYNTLENALADRAAARSSPRSRWTSRATPSARSTNTSSATSPMREGQKGGEFFTPTSHRQAHRRDHRAVPRPHLRPGLRLRRHVRAERPASSRATSRTPEHEISIYGQERVDETVRLA